MIARSSSSSMVHLQEHEDDVATLSSSSSLGRRQEHEDGGTDSIIDQLESSESQTDMNEATMLGYFRTAQHQELRQKQQLFEEDHNEHLPVLEEVVNDDENEQDTEEQRHRKTESTLWEPRGMLFDSHAANSGSAFGVFAVKVVDLSSQGRVMALVERNETARMVQVWEWDGLAEPTPLWIPRGDSVSTTDEQFATSLALSSRDGTVLAVRSERNVRVYQYNRDPSEWTPLGNRINAFDRDDSIELCGISGDGFTVAILHQQAYDASFDGIPSILRVYGYTDAWRSVGADIPIDPNVIRFVTACDLAENGNAVAVAGEETYTTSAIQVMEYTGRGLWFIRGGPISVPGPYASAVQIARRFPPIYNLLSISQGILTVAFSTAPDSPRFPSQVQVYQYNENFRRWTRQGQALNEALDFSGDVYTVSMASGDGRTVARRTKDNIRLYEYAALSYSPRWRTVSEMVSANDASHIVLSSDGSAMAVREIGPGSIANNDGTLQVYVSTGIRGDPLPTQFFCFAGDATVVVQVQGDGDGDDQQQQQETAIPGVGRRTTTVTKTMKDLQQGDRILVGDDQFEPIYLFGHKLNDVHHTGFLQITVFRGQRQETEDDEVHHVLTLTPNHMVFVASEQQQQERALPASRLQPGQHVFLATTVASDDATRQPSSPLSWGTITKIEPATAVGLFAPFTPSGRLVVDGVQVSAFSTLQTHREYLHIGGHSTGLSQQWVDQTLTLPLRLRCVDWGSCDEHYDDTGMSVLLHTPYQVYQWWRHQTATVQSIAAVPLGLSLAVMGGVDAILHHDQKTLSEGPLVLVVVPTLMVAVLACRMCGKRLHGVRAKK